MGLFGNSGGFSRKSGGFFGGSLIGGSLFGGGVGSSIGRSSGSGLFGSGISSVGIPESVVPDNSHINLAWEAIKHSDTLAGELCRTVDDAKDEFMELCTDGVVEMVIKGNKAYKTSFEIKDEADERIGDARYKFEERCYKFNEYLDSLNTKINYLYEKKVELAKRVDQKVRSTPGIQRISLSIESPTYTYKPSTIGMLYSCSMSRYSLGSDVKGRKDSANAHLENAKDFEVEIDMKIAEINRAQAFLETVEQNLDEEKMLIEALNESLNKGEKVAYDKLTHHLQVLITEYILDSDGKRNEKYMIAIEHLKYL